MMPKSQETQKADNDLVMSFLALRRAVGILGFFLPAVLVAYGLVVGGTFLPTMSSYYYSPMSDIFVGTLAANAVFLWSYEGYRPKAGEIITDRHTARAASLGALGIALAPVIGSGTKSCSIVQCMLGIRLTAYLHYANAIVFFSSLAVFCLILFVRHDGHCSSEKEASNRIYRSCGWIIIGAMVAIGGVKLIDLDVIFARLSLVFWLEVAAVLAFAISWLVKGDARTALVNMARPG